MALKRTAARRRSFGGGGTTTFTGGGGSSRMGLEEYTQRLEASHRLQVERSMISNENILERSAASSEMSMARWLAQNQVQLTNRRDTEALERIGKGDAAYGMTYAKRRLQEADTDDDRLYWQDILSRAKEKAEDDYIEGLVKSGDMEPADIMPILQQRRDKQRVGSPGYLALSKQIGELNNAIKADAFNKEVATAQAKYAASGDKKALMGSLLSLYGRAKESTARTALSTRITNLQKELDTEEETKRQAAITKKVADYYADRGANPASGVLFALAEAVTNAKTPAEAQRLITLAQSITTRERTLQQDALRGAGGGGRGGSGTTAAQKAVDDELRDERADAKAAAAHIKEDILDNKKIPTDAEWAIYWATTDRTREAVNQVIAAGGPQSVIDKLVKETAAIDKQRKDFKDTAGANVVARSQTLQSLITTGIAKAKGEGAGAAEGIKATAAMIAELRKLGQSPFIEGADDHTAAVAKNVSEAEKPLSDEMNRARTVFEPEGGIPPALSKLYDKYVESWTNKYPGSPERPVTFAQWYAVMSDTTLDPAEKASELELPPTSTSTGTLTWPAGLTPHDQEQGFTNAVNSAKRQFESSLATARVASAVLAGKRPDAHDLYDVNEVLTGRVDMEARRAQRLAGLITPEQLAEIERSAREGGAPDGRTVIGGAGDKAFDPRSQGHGILLGADQHVFESLFSDPQGGPTGYEQPTMDPGMMGPAGGGFEPMVNEMERGTWEDAAASGRPNMPTAYEYDAGEDQGWRSLVGSNPERSAYDYLDATADLSPWMGEAVLPDEDEEFPFISPEAVEMPDFPDFPFKVQEHEYEQPEPEPEPDEDDQPTGYDRPTILE